MSERDAREILRELLAEALAGHERQRRDAAGPAAAGGRRAPPVDVGRPPAR